jgi:hypothetical protein
MTISDLTIVLKATEFLSTFVPKLTGLWSLAKRRERSRFWEPNIYSYYQEIISTF